MDPIPAFYFKRLLLLGIPGSAMVKSLPPTVGYTEAVVRPLDQEDSLEEEMATHARILAWKIPWTEEPGSL